MGKIDRLPACPCEHRPMTEGLVLECPEHHTRQTCLEVLPYGAVIRYEVMP